MMTTMMAVLVMLMMMMSGLLHVGDIIKEINGQEVLTPEQLQELMKKYSGTITFKIIPSSQDQNSSMKVFCFIIHKSYTLASQSVIL